MHREEVSQRKQGIARRQRLLSRQPTQFPFPLLRERHTRGAPLLHPALLGIGARDHAKLYSSGYRRSISPTVVIPILSSSWRLVRRTAGPPACRCHRGLGSRRISTPESNANVAR